MPIPGVGRLIFPWRDTDGSVPTPKQKKHLSRVLANVDRPTAYDDIFNAYATNGVVTIASLQSLMSTANLAEHDKETVVSLVLPGDASESNLDRSLTSVALVLIALAQKGEELSLDAVDDCKGRGLPVPKLEPSMSKTTRYSPEDTSKRSDDQRPISPQQTTLDPFVTRTSQPDNNVGATSPSKRSGRSHDSAHREDVGDPWTPEGSVPHTPPFEPEQSNFSRAEYTGTPVSRGALEFDAVVIRALDGKEGLPLWKHINYE